MENSIQPRLNFSTQGTTVVTFGRVLRYSFQSRDFHIRIWLALSATPREWPWLWWPYTHTHILRFRVSEIVVSFYFLFLRVSNAIEDGTSRNLKLAQTRIFFSRGKFQSICKIEIFDSFGFLYLSIYLSIHSCFQCVRILDISLLTGYHSLTDRSNAANVSQMNLL